MPEFGSGRTIFRQLDDILVDDELRKVVVDVLDEDDEIEVRFEIVLDGRRNDCLMLSMLMLGPLDDEARSEDPEDVLDLNLVLLRMSRFSILSSSLSASSGSKSKDRSCKS